MLKLLATTALTLFLVSGAHAAGDTHAVGDTGNAGDAAAGQTKAAVCGACHGPDGNSPLNVNPKLAGQHAQYIEKQLHDFKSTKRPSATMVGMVATLDEQGIADVAAWFSSQTRSNGEADPALVDAGQTLYRGGNPDTGVPACAGCHGATGLGVGSANFPSLAGQHAQYMITELGRFKSGERGNDNARMMRDIAARMSDDEMAAVASYMEGMR
jgi:cytochrome c553